MFRNEKPGPGRFRQFMQFDADTVGAASPAADAEMCMMAADTMEELGIPRGQYVIKVNSRKVLDGVMEAIGVADERQKLTVLRAIDKLDRLGIEGVRDLLGAGPQGREWRLHQGRRLLDRASGRDTSLEDARSAKRPVTLATGRNGHRSRGARRTGRDRRAMSRRPATARDRIRIDASVVRGLEYYTGPVFEAELLFEIPNEKGEPVRLRLGRRRRAL